MKELGSFIFPIYFYGEKMNTPNVTGAPGLDNRQNMNEPKMVTNHDRKTKILCPCCACYFRQHTETWSDGFVYTENYCKNCGHTEVVK